MKKQSRFITAAKYIAIALLFVIALEVVVRALGVVDINTYRGWGYSLDGYGDLRPNQKFFAVYGGIEHPYYVETNSFGLRNSYDITVEKPPGTFRAIAVGDSFTYGVYSDNTETFTAQLEMILDEMFETKEYEILNAGVSGYTIQDEYGYILEKGRLLDPDMIILGVYQNDVYDFSPANRESFGRKSNDSFRDVVTTSWWFNLIRDNSHLFALGLNIMRGMETARVTETLDVPLNETDYYRVTFSDNCSEECRAYWNSFDDYFVEMADFTKEKNMQLLVVIFPDYWQFEGTYNMKFTEHVETLCSQNNVTCLDLYDAFRRDGNIDMIFLRPWNNHLSRYGNWVAAKAISNVLIQDMIN